MPESVSMIVIVITDDGPVQLQITLERDANLTIQEQMQGMSASLGMTLAEEYPALFPYRFVR